MSLVLYRFPGSQYSEKARTALDFKGLEYTVVDLSPGADQWMIYKKTGQRMLPVLEHNGAFIHDSTAIALYLEHAFPEGKGGTRALLPDDFKRRREVLDFEDRLDTVFGMPGRIVLTEQCLRDGVWLEAVAGANGAKGPAVWGVKGASVFARVATLLPPVQGALEAAHKEVRSLLHECCDRIAETGFLVGDTPTLADVAAAGLSLHLYWPDSAYLGVPALRDKGVAEYVNDPVLGRFFEWKKRFYSTYLK